MDKTARDNEGCRRSYRALKARKLVRQEEVASVINLDRSQISKWLKGDRDFSEDQIHLIGEFLDGLDRDNPRKPARARQSFKMPATNHVPVVGFAAAKNFDRTESSFDRFLADAGETMEWPDAGPGCAVFVGSGESLRPIYPDGTLFLFDPNQIPQRGDLVVAMLEGEDIPVVKRYNRRGSNIMLESISRHTGVDYEIAKEERWRLRWWFPVLKATIDLRRQRFDYMSTPTDTEDHICTVENPDCNTCAYAPK